MILAMRDRLNTSARALPEWPIYLIGLVPAVWLIWQGVTGGLGVDPVKVMEHQLGEWGLQFLLATLCITPLLRYARINLCKFRRPLGLLGFTYVSLHFLVWLLLDLQLRWAEIGTDLVKRPYIVVGFVAFILLVPLALTSWKGAIRRMGSLNWNRLHMLSYVVVILGGVHFVMQEKVWTAESLIYLGLAVVLVGMRFLWLRRF